MSAGDIFLLSASIFVTVLAGWIVLYLITGREIFAEIPFAERISLAYLFGIGAITFEMFLLSFFNIGYMRSNILIPWVFPVALASARMLRRGNRGKEDTSPRALSRYRRQEAMRGPDILLAILIAMQVFYNFFRAIIKPIESYDAVAIYGLKAKIIYLAGGISGNFFQNLSGFFQGSHPDYPLFVPLSETWIYTFLGRFDDMFVKILFPLLYLAFLTVFYSVLKRITGTRRLALLFTFILATIKQFSDYATIGLSDLPLGIYFALGIMYIYLWMSEKEKTYFLKISALSLALCTWTKNEGVLLAFFGLVALLAYAVRNKPDVNTRSIFIYAAFVLAFIAAWRMFIFKQGIVNENFNVSMLGSGNFMSGLGKLPLIAYEFQKHIFGFKKWNIFWVLLLLVFFNGLRYAFSGNTKYITYILIMFLFGYTLVYMFSAVEIDFFLRKTWSRFLLHILPLAVFWTALMLYSVKKTEKA
ncbi:MAG: hypothetical protein JW994_06025 [Candidatus Omnitrophica bacterium]|nr:hypothetical protein [Candidatus Omnitrophota bacterium]